MPEEYTGPRTCELCEDSKKAPCTGKGCNIVNGLKDFRLKGAKQNQSADLESKLTLDEWEISWADVDYVEIQGPHNQMCMICGGDFESMLSALCAAFNEGRVKPSYE